MSLETIINEYNLGEAKRFKINNLGEDLNYNKFKELSKDLIVCWNVILCAFSI